MGDTDMRPVLTTIAAAAAEFIYLPIFTAEAGFVVAQSKEAPGLENVKLMSADGSFSQNFVGCWLTPCWHTPAALAPRLLTRISWPSMRRSMASRR